MFNGSHYRYFYYLLAVVCQMKVSG